MKKRIPSEKELASKHNVSVKYIIRQAEIGSTVEREHTTSHEEAYGIALQHLDEFPNYYESLLAMEKKMKAEHDKKSVKKIREELKSKLLENKEENKEEKKFCNLCQKPETKDECSYGPKAWERFSVPLPLKK